MNKYLLHTILAMVVLYSQFYNSFVTAVYQANYDYYAEVLCENKDKPELHCDGKCYFAKQLAQEENYGKDTEPPVLLPSLRLFSGYETVELPTNLESCTLRSYASFNQTLPRDFFLSRIDHPPKV